MSPSRQNRKSEEPLTITSAMLRCWPLPQPEDDADKEARGRVLIVGGSPEMPGAVILAATAALRAGAGKLRIATINSIAQTIAATVPEARVFSLPATKDGAIALSSAQKLAGLANEVQSVLIGPGMVGEEASCGLLSAVLPMIEEAVVVLDAMALSLCAEDAGAVRRLEGQSILTPHAGEMAHMLGIEKEQIVSDSVGTVRRVSESLRAVCALKGSNTVIAAPKSPVYRNTAGNVGLATSGSGDTLSGIIAGLAARGVVPLQATVWGVYLHARAGDRLAKRMGKLGFLARELLDEVPRIMSSLDGSRRRQSM